MSILSCTFVSARVPDRVLARVSVNNPHKNPEIGAGATFDMMKQQRDLCAHCAHREKLRKLLGVLFCDKSSTTRVHPKQHCDEYEERGTQLELFQ